MHVCLVSRSHRLVHQLRIAYEWTEDFVIKYLWSAAGYGLISIPVFFNRTRSIGIQAPSTTESIDNAIADRTESKALFDDDDRCKF